MANGRYKYTGTEEEAQWYKEEYGEWPLGYVPAKEKKPVTEKEKLAEERAAFLRRYPKVTPKEEKAAIRKGWIKQERAEPRGPKETLQERLFRAGQFTPEEKQEIARKKFLGKEAVPKYRTAPEMVNEFNKQLADITRQKTKVLNIILDPEKSKTMDPATMEAQISALNQQEKVYADSLNMVSKIQQRYPTVSPDIVFKGLDEAQALLGEFSNTMRSLEKQGLNITEARQAAEGLFLQKYPGKSINELAKFVYNIKPEAVPAFVGTSPIRK